MSDRVSKEILDKIVAQGLRPGHRLPTEREMAEQFEVSRTVVREALRGLIGKGLIDARPGRGLRVAALDSSAVSETMALYLHGLGSLNYDNVHEVRALLEPEIAALAAARATDKEIGVLRGIVSRGEVAAATKDVQTLREADRDFHRLLTASSHNHLWIVLMDAIREPLADIREVQTELPTRAKSAFAEHRSVLDAIERRDSDGARRAMEGHLTSTWSTWKSMAAGPDLARFVRDRVERDRRRGSTEWPRG